MRESATLIILAGGQSIRMGRPKHLLYTPQGGTVTEHIVQELGFLFTETLVVGRNLTVPSNSDMRAVEDLYPARSPSVGIYSGLLSAETDLCFVIACDMPFVRPSLVEHILSQSREADVCVPIVNDYYEPLCAAYRRSAIPAIYRAIEHGLFKVTAPYNDLNLYTLPEEELRCFDRDLISFTNLNVPRQLGLLAQL